MKTGRLKIAGLVVLALVTVACVAAYRLLKVEDIPETLEAPLDPATLSIAGVGEQPDLAVAQLRGQTAFFVFVGIRSFSGEEGRALNRALNRWDFPEGTRGYIVFDAEGFGFLKAKSAEYLERFASEARFPMYGDFEGAFRNVFKLPQGHHGLVVVDPQGEIALRHSGGMDKGDAIDGVRALLGAAEPPQGPPVPEFVGEGLSTESCAATPCALVFLGRSVALTEVPWVDGGFEGDQKARWAQARKPEVRDVSLSLGLPLGANASGLLVGRTPGVELPAGWAQTASSPELREAFGLAPDATAFVVLANGRVAFRNEGVVAFHQLGRISDLLGVEVKTDD